MPNPTVAELIAKARSLARESGTTVTWDDDEAEFVGWISNGLEKGHMFLRAKIQPGRLPHLNHPYWRQFWVTETIPLVVDQEEYTIDPAAPAAPTLNADPEDVSATTGFLVAGTYIFGYTFRDPSNGDESPLSPTLTYVFMALAGDNVVKLDFPAATPGSRFTDIRVYRTLVGGSVLFADVSYTWNTAGLTDQEVGLTADASLVIGVPDGVRFDFLHSLIDTNGVPLRSFDAIEIPLMRSSTVLGSAGGYGGYSWLPEGQLQVLVAPGSRGTPKEVRSLSLRGWKGLRHHESGGQTVQIRDEFTQGAVRFAIAEAQISVRSANLELEQEAYQILDRIPPPESK